MPGPASPFCLSFPEDFIAQGYREVRRRSAEHRLVQRFQLAILLHQNPRLSHDQAGNRVGLSARQVRRWRQRWAAGDFTVADLPGRGCKARFSPLDEALVRAIACETVFQTERPLSRQSLADLTARARTALGKPISGSTVWRILDADAIKPWQYEYWIFPRDPQFAEKAGPILDLYAGFWQGRPLTAQDYILSADEKTSIQARLRCHPGLGPAPGRPRRVEFEYDRGGALQYLAAWDVRQGYVIGRCEWHTGIVPFGRLVTQGMEQEPYRSAGRGFWIVDNGSSHRGQAAVRRLMRVYPRAILLHTPVHASWLNQIEIYFSLVQRKVLTPNEFSSLAEVERRLRLYEELTNRTPRSFAWKFDRAKLSALLDRLEAKRASQTGEAVVM
jgi:homeodomain-containing protein/DDE superfamily endonuclease